MASNSRSNNDKKNSYSSSWTLEQNKRFENALASYDELDEGSPDWQNIAEKVGDKSVEEVKRHFEILKEDLRNIESGLVEIPKYNEKKGPPSQAS